MENYAEISDVLRVHNPSYFHSLKTSIGEITSNTQIKYGFIYSIKILMFL